MEGFTRCFAEPDDPRGGIAGRHDMVGMLVIAVCTLLAGGEDCTDLAAFAETKRGFLKPERRAPSHDTFSRLFRLLDPALGHARLRQAANAGVATARRVCPVPPPAASRHPMPLSSITLGSAARAHSLASV